MNEQREDLIRLHGALLEDYADFYQDREAREAEGVSLEEAAGGMLEHFGMLYRYTGDQALLKEFLAMPETDKYTLAHAAAEYLQSDTLLATAHNLYQETLLSEGQFAQAESLFFRRDEFAVILDMIRTLAWNNIEQPEDPLHALFFNALEMETELDRLLRTQPALAATAGAPVRGLSQAVAEGCLPAHYWWLTDWAAQEAASKEAGMHAWLVKALSPGSVPAVRGRIWLGKWVEKARVLLTSREPLPALAAATSTRVVLAVLDTDARTEVEFRISLEGVHVCVLEKSEGTRRFVGGTLCIFSDDESSAQAPLAVSLGQYGYVSVPWEVIPENAAVGLKTRDGVFTGWLIPVEDTKADED